MTSICQRWAPYPTRSMASAAEVTGSVVNLLLRFVDPWDGRISIDGEDIRRFKLDSLRRPVPVAEEAAEGARAGAGGGDGTH